MTMLVKVEQVGPRSLNVDVSSEAVRRAGASGRPVYTRDDQRQYVRDVLEPMGFRVPPAMDGHLNPVYIVPKRGIANSGFRALVSLR